MSERNRIENIKGIYISFEPLPIADGQETIHHKGLQYYSVVKTKTRISYIKDKRGPQLQDKVAGLANQLGTDCAVIGDSYVDGKGELWHKIDFHVLSVDSNKDEEYVSNKIEEIHESIIKQESMRLYNFYIDMLSVIFLIISAFLIITSLMGLSTGLTSNFGVLMGYEITGYSMLISLAIASSALFLFRCYRSPFPMIPRIHFSSL